MFPGLGKRRWEEGQVAQLERKIGQQALEIDFLKGCCSASTSSGNCRHWRESRCLPADPEPKGRRPGLDGERQMDWCLDCHRHPEKVLRPVAFITTMGSGGRPGANRAPTDGGISHTKYAPVDELFHLPPMSDLPKYLDLAGARARLEAKRGREFWRNLEDLAATPEFEDLLQREFPRQAIGWSEDEDSVEGRRNFLKMMGASLALAGLTACTRQPTEHIMPYVRQPEELIPGRPLFYATAVTLGGVANGVLVESHEGRPTKVEGNPEHPGTLGALDASGQASVLPIYDPDRSRTASEGGEIRSWADFLGMLRGLLEQQRSSGGAGIRPDRNGDVAGDGGSARPLRSCFLPPSHQWEPAGPHSARTAAMLAFGEPLHTYYNVANANVIVSLDADFLASGEASLRYARQFAARRRVEDGGNTSMNRLYVVEPMPTPTGTKADQRLRYAPAMWRNPPGRWPRASAPLKARRKATTATSTSGWMLDGKNHWETAIVPYRVGPCSRWRIKGLRSCEGIERAAHNFRSN